MGRLLYPPMIQWEVTPYCNHDCIHCYNYWRSTKDKKSDILFNKGVSEKYYLDIAERLVEAKPVRVTITGGEPLSVFDKLKCAIDLLLDAGIFVSLNTNATLISQEIVDYLVKNKISLFVSFPCAEESICDYITGRKGSFDRIVESLKTLRNANVSLGINMVVSKVNHKYVYQTAKFVKEELGLNYFCATKVSLPINAKQEFRDKVLSNEEYLCMLDELIKIKEELDMEIDSSAVYCFCSFDNNSQRNEFTSKRMCNAGKTTFALTADGKIKACARDSKIYGDIMKEPFYKAIVRMEEWQNNSFYPQECIKCKFLRICGGGCRINAEIEGGDIKGLDPLVNLKNANIDYVIKNNVQQINFSTMTLNKDCLFVKEEKCYRISLGQRYYFISNKFYEFLKSNVEFKVEDIAFEFKLEISLTKSMISSLFRAKMIINV